MAVTSGVEAERTAGRPDGARRWPPVEETPRWRSGGLVSLVGGSTVAATPRPHPRSQDTDG